MNTQQNFRARVPPSRGPTGGAPIKHSSLIGSNRPEVLAAGRANLMKSQHQPDTNTNVSQYPAQTSETEKTRDYLSTEAGTLSNNEDTLRNAPISEADEPEIKPKKRFSESRKIGDEDQDEAEIGGNDEHTSHDLLTLSQSLKAMKSLRDNFQSFEYGMEDDTYQQNQSDRAYKEVDEEDYVKVESEEQIREYDEEEEREEGVDENYEGEYSRESESEYRGSAKMKDQYIEEIQEQPRREEEDQEDEKPILETEQEALEADKATLKTGLGENLYIGQYPSHSHSVNNDPEEFTANSYKAPEVDQPMPTQEVHTPKDERVREVVENEKNQFLDEFEYGDKKTIETNQEDLPVIPKSTGAKMVSPFGPMGSKSQQPKSGGLKKPSESPFGVKQPFGATSYPGESKAPIQSPAREQFIEPVRPQQQNLSENNENSYLVRLKQIEIELAKERKKNEYLEAERETVLTENRSLKQENTETKAELETYRKIKDKADRSNQKEQDAIIKLREELKTTIENSRLIAEHSNKVINENVRYKQDMENLVTTLEGERDQLQQKITELTSQFNDERLKIENFQQRAESFERKAHEYEESFDLIQKQLKERMDAFQKLVSLNTEAQSTIQSLPKVEELIARLQPQHQTISVQTSQILSPPKVGVKAVKDDYPSFEGQANVNKSQSSIRKSQNVEDSLIRKSQQAQESVPIISTPTDVTPNTKPMFKAKTPFVSTEVSKPIVQAVQKDNSGLRSEKNISIKSETDFNFSPNFKDHNYSKLTSSVLTDDPREEGKKTFKPFDVDEDLSLLVGNQTLLEMVATPQTAKPVKKDPFKTEGIIAQKDKSSDIESPIARIGSNEEVSNVSVKKAIQIRPNFGTKPAPKTTSIKKEVTRDEILASPQNLEDTIRNKNPMTEHSDEWGLEDSIISSSSLNKSIQQSEKNKQTAFSTAQQLEITTQPKGMTFSQAEPSPKVETPKPKVKEEKSEPVASKPVFSLPSGKSVVPSFAKSGQESKSKELNLTKTVSGSQEKSPAGLDKPNFGLNLASSQNKGGLRYAQPKKNIDKSTISVEADNFFDELGVSEDPFKGGNPLRESATSLRSNTTRTSQTLVKKKF